VHYWPDKCGCARKRMISAQIGLLDDDDASDREDDDDFGD
jgi:hypothetical protein